MSNPQYMDDEMPEMPELETNPPDDVKPSPCQRTMSPIDKMKSKVIGMLHDLAADADKGDSKLRDGSYLTDRVREIIVEVGKWPEHGRGIGNWNFNQLARMSRNPNTRRNSSRT